MSVTWPKADASTETISETSASFERVYQVSTADTNSAATLLQLERGITPGATYGPDPRYYVAAVRPRKIGKSLCEVSVVFQRIPEGSVRRSISVTLASERWTHDLDGNQIGPNGEGVTVLVPRATIRVAGWLNYFPGASVYANIRKVNSDAFKGVPAGYLFLRSVEADQVVGENWSISVTFDYDPAGFQPQWHKLDAKTGAILSTETARVYESTSFNALFGNWQMFQAFDLL